MNDLQKKPHWSLWIGRLAFVLGVGSALYAFVGAFGAGQDWWSKLAGVGAYRNAFFMALLAIVLAVIGLIFFRKKHANIAKLSLIGLIFAGGFAGYIGTQLSKASKVPRIHDVSTDLENPPVFSALSLREDNLKNMPGADDPAMAGLDALGRWKKMHVGAYADIKTVTVNMSVSQVISKAEAIAKKNEWVVATADAETGVFEATDSVALFKFKDDVVLRIAPSPDGNGSVVDMRSVSRVGLSDLGVNADRVRDFLADLQK